MKKRAPGRLARPELERSSPDLSQGSVATLAPVFLRFSHPYSSPKGKLQTVPRRGDALIVGTQAGHFPFQVSAPPSYRYSEETGGFYPLDSKRALCGYTGVGGPCLTISGPSLNS